MRPIARSRSTSCAARAARRNSSPRIRADRCRCWKSRKDATSPNPTPSSGMSRRHAAGAGIADRARRGAAVDVLRAACAGAEYRRRLFLAGAGQGRPRLADARAGRLDGARLRRAAGDGKSPQDPSIILPPASSPSPTSRSTATPMSPTAATTTSRPFRRSAPGCAGSSRPRLCHHGLAAGEVDDPAGPTRSRISPRIAAEA